ncbi:MAG: serine/threonine protein kinase [Chloroflexi bacterium]|nr:serine/threonine protein kinase [Chloroflexota bacterium]MBV6437003.1 Serine/threonine-protein kinase PknD [Anaerolineae bacterium]MDL1916202.1 serine/threonine protein kinase [Anaerolineae bacterium CFX4]OQY86160.1 MAG: hypothetical protein B6D42_01920 [Anaerolineae bacterium UTCFX5]MCC6565086.1 serine/threonine protein kinase [Chloroflexota bacterium]
MDIGDVINKSYQVVEHIGRGGMADVWSARDSKLNRMVAVKTILHGLSPDSDPLGMFKREAQTIAALEHPHILPVYDFGEYQNSLFIVMRYVSGGSLAAWMERSKLPIDEAMRVLAAVAQALDYAHGRNVIHLDLKPQNILLDTHLSPYLGDFGLATALDVSGRAQNPGSGTLLYMAPEQLTSDTLDKRADIYSFAIMAFHILNGRLPFDGASPMVMKQLQLQSELPEIPHLSPTVTTVLRKSASLDLDGRHATTTDMVEELRAALNLTGPLRLAGSGELIPNVPADLQEPAGLYQRARAAWDGGQGRFVLGVTDFLVMETAYAASDQNGLELDDLGRQMLLRGALEYGINVDHWWGALDDANRRWVCLHTVRSANAPARVRAMERLEDLPDDEPPRIPRLIAQALQAEVDDSAKLAALHLLGKRAREHIQTAPVMPALTQTMTRVMMTVTRVEQLEAQPDEWLSTTFGPEVDLLIAEMALDPAQPKVSEAAARTVANMHSRAAVKYLADQQRAGRRGALRALAIVRDEVPSLPDVVSPLGRGYAWIANTMRRLTADPLSLTWRFLFAMLGGALGRGFLLWTTFDFPFTVFNSWRFANTIAYGLSFGAIFGLVVIITDEFSARLRGFWKWPMRAGAAFIAGAIMGTLLWASDHYLFLNRTVDLQWDLVLFGGFGVALGLAFNGLLRLRAWIAVALTAVSIYLPVYISWSNYCTPYGLCSDSPPFSVGPVALVGLLIGLFCGLILRVQIGPIGIQTPFKLTPPISAALGLALGLAWALIAPLTYDLGLSNPPLTWVGMLGFVLVGLIPGVLAGYLFSGPGQFAFSIASVLAFVVLLPAVQPVLQTNGPFPIAFDALVYPRVYADFTYENLHIFTGAIPFAILMALGAHAQLIARELRAFVQSRRPARAMSEPGGMTEFLNKPKAALPDTATIIEAVKEAREELSASGTLDANTVRDSRASAFSMTMPLDDDATGQLRPPPKDEDSEIRRARESDA